MGVKFRPSVVKTVKQGNGTTTKTNEHSYMSAASVKDIKDMLNSTSTLNKRKDKLRKELIRRGIKDVSE